jgi:uncharacterized membrane protein
LTVPVINTAGLTSAQVSGELGARLNQDWQTFFGYAFAFVMIAVWWTYHHRTFRYIERYDTVLMWANMMLLLEIAVMPFVLQLYSTYSNAQVAVVLFAVMQIAAALTLNFIWRYASSGHRLVTPSLDSTEIAYFAKIGLVTPLVFAVSIGVSFVSVEAAQFVWIVAIVARRFGARNYGPA